jgi:hypothetical protein
MKKIIFLSILALFLSKLHSQTVCDVFRTILVDGANKFQKFYGENNGAVSGFNLNGVKSARKDMLDGQLFTNGTITNVRLSDIYEDVSMKGELWTIMLDGPKVDYSSVAVPDRAESLKQSLKLYVEPLAKQCFPDFLLSDVQMSSLVENPGNESDTEMCHAFIYMKQATLDGVLVEKLLYLTPHIKISVKQDANDHTKYYFTYAFNYPLED